MEISSENVEVAFLSEYARLVVTCSTTYCRSESIDTYILQNMENPVKRFSEEVLPPALAGSTPSMQREASIEQSVAQLWCAYLAGSRTLGPTLRAMGWG